MKAAIVTGPGQTPEYGDFDDPAPEAGHELVTVTASALSHAAKAMAAGSHYGSAGTYPKVAGIDGTGRTTGGQRVYFTMPQAPFGAMADRALVPAGNCVALPDGLDDVTAAAIANPGMSSVAALTARASLHAGETVLVHGATGAAGTLAVQLARHLGAGKVIAAGRDAAALERAAALGADVTISLLQEASTVEAALASCRRPARSRQHWPSSSAETASTSSWTTSTGSGPRRCWPRSAGSAGSPGPSATSR